MKRVGLLLLVAAPFVLAGCGASEPSASDDAKARKLLGGPPSMAGIAAKQHPKAAHERPGMGGGPAGAPGAPGAGAPAPAAGN